MTHELTPDELIEICCRLDEPERVDLAIVPGCTEQGNDPDFALRNRVQRCLELLQGGYFRRILLTGGAPIDVDRHRRSEAERMRELLDVQRSVDLDILMECEARNTRENAERSFVALELQAPQLLHSLKSMMIITCDYHTRRACHEFEQVFRQCRILGCGFRNQGPYLLEKCRRELVRLERLGLVDAPPFHSRRRQDEVNTSPGA